MKTNLGTWRKEALKKYSGNRDENSIAINAILKKVLNKDQVWILSNLELELQSNQLDKLDQYLNRLILQEPLPYILEEAEFFGYPFYVTPDVLIPRPETELLVEHVIQWIKQSRRKESIKLLDIGTGSGCIPISVLKTNPEINSFALDISRKALKVAKRNAEKNEIREINFIQTNLISAITGKFQIVTGNLPYIPTNEYKKLRVAIYEPALALDGGDDGLMVYRQLFKSVSTIVASPGFCIFEIHHDQGVKIRELANISFHFDSIKILQDYSGFDRFLSIEV